ncbi:natural killer cell receptor 2B4 isoform X6 [Manis pentadactyla]|uniref:natural killer cell receptor 2B4 isoform X6 n=1 Tax=Manis pentadactyla TaxID=143292 RepID=UPI00255C5B5A|nr:natural killer cell receptor 2B4 isoform X6 [Manis pentadactyla]
MFTSFSLGMRSLRVRCVKHDSRGPQTKSQDSAHHVVRLSGASVCLRPSSTVRIEAYSVRWKVQWPSNSKCYVILTWKNTLGMKYENRTLNHFNNRLRFSIQDLTLHIDAAQHQDSGLYFLELTNQSGHVSQCKFQVSVFDHVEEPRVLGQWKALDTGKCQVTLSCLVSRGGDVSYAWYRGSELIRTSRNLTRLEVQIDVNSSHTYACNVSNPVSWADNTLTLTPGCLTGHQKTSPEELLTIYEDVNNPQIRRNQRQKQNSPGEGTTIYSMIQSQPSASTSQETTLYSLVQPSRKSGTKKKSHGSSLNNTVYDEVGRREPRAQNPVRLSCKELESFYVYS